MLRFAGRTVCPSASPILMADTVIDIGSGVEGRATPVWPAKCHGPKEGVGHHSAKDGRSTTVDAGERRISLQHCDRYPQIKVNSDLSSIVTLRPSNSDFHIGVGAMRLLLPFTALGLLTSGCTEQQLALASPDFSQRNGYGAVSQTPDGTQTFTFMVPANAHNFVAEGEREQSRLQALAVWLGGSKYCPRGYAVDKRTEYKEVHHVIYYAGHCK